MKACLTSPCLSFLSEWAILIVSGFNCSLDFISDSLMFQVSLLLFLSTQMVLSFRPLISDLDFPVRALKEGFQNLPHQDKLSSVSIIHFI